jgi:LmbE family N-acetylglucosaminyl deacetylase
VLCLGAHCDDIEIGCGGTLLQLIEKGAMASVKWVVFASDEVRKQEALKSAGQFLDGAPRQEVLILDFPDAFLPFKAAEVKQFFEGLKDFQPDVVFTHFRDDRHQDHRLISDLTWNTFRNHLILEYEIPKYDGDLGSPNCFSPLTEAQAQKKVDVLLGSFESQRSKHWFEAETFQALMRLRALECAHPGRYAEAFYVRKYIWKQSSEP